MRALLSGIWWWLPFGGGRRARRRCFHHDHLKGMTYLRSRLIDMGQRKMFWCTKCGQAWFV